METQTVQHSTGETPVLISEPGSVEEITQPKKKRKRKKKAGEVRNTQYTCKKKKCGYTVVHSTDMDIPKPEECPRCKGKRFTVKEL